MTLSILALINSLISVKVVSIILRTMHVNRQRILRGMQHNSSKTTNSAMIISPEPNALPTGFT